MTKEEVLDEIDGVLDWLLANGRCVFAWGYVREKVRELRGKPSDTN